jgi:hypothetical protein
MDYRRCKNMGRFFARLRKRANRVGNAMDKYQEAIAFAEAGEREPAERLGQRQVPQERRTGKLLVVGQEGRFSAEVIDYALDMAKRLSYDILALNTAPLSSETFRLFSSSQGKLCQDFRALSEENAKSFQEAAQRQGIDFTHVVKFSARDEAIEEVSREFGNIEFVVSDSEEERPVERPEEGERAKQAIYVYSMI